MKFFLVRRVEFGCECCERGEEETFYFMDPRIKITVDIEEIIAELDIKLIKGTTKTAGHISFSKEEDLCILGDSDIDFNIAKEK